MNWYLDALRKYAVFSGRQEAHPITIAHFT